MNAKPITAPNHVTLVLLVQYTRDRRSSEVKRFAAVDADTARLHGQRWEHLKEAMNSVTVRAIRDGYDMELLSWIVNGATDRQLMDLACDATVNDQVVAMATAMRTPVEAPKAKARKAPATVEPELIEATLKSLRTCTTRTSAREYLKLLRVIELRAVSKAIELGTQSKLRKDELIEYLIDFTVQAKLDHDAILKVK